jgi:hypothetical protein
MAASVPKSQAVQGQQNAPAMASSGAPGGSIANPASGARPADAAPLAPGGLSYGPNLGDQGDPATLARLVDSQLGTSAFGQVPQSNPAAASSSGAAPPCEVEGVTAAGLGGQHPVVRYAASLRWRGQEAVVLVYDRPAGGRSAVVMAVSGCSLLTVLPA